MLTLYGLKSCDTCRQARAWLDERGIGYRYHDVRADGLDAGLLKRWFARGDWSSLVNRRSITWRKIPETDRASLDEARAIALLIDNPTLLKRPVLDGEALLLVGFSADLYAGKLDGSGRRGLH